VNECFSFVNAVKALKAILFASKASSVFITFKGFCLKSFYDFFLF
jgi:hypothetical protein